VGLQDYKIFGYLCYGYHQPPVIIKSCELRIQGYSNTLHCVASGFQDDKSAVILIRILISQDAGNHMII